MLYYSVGSLCWNITIIIVRLTMYVFLCMHIGVYVCRYDMEVEIWWVLFLGWKGKHQIKIVVYLFLFYIWAASQFWLRVIYVLINHMHYLCHFNKYNFTSYFISSGDDELHNFYVNMIFSMRFPHYLNLRIYFWHHRECDLFSKTFLYKFNEIK